MAKPMTHDGNGYINNRGISRYWGVTVRSNNGSSSKIKEWCVSYSALDLDQTHTLASVDFKLTEKDAARVAAFIYDKGQMFKNIGGNVFIKSSCGRYAMYINRSANTIRRSRIDKVDPSLLYKGKATTLFDVADQPKEKEVETTETVDVFALLVQVVSKITLTKAQATSIKSLVDSRVK